jgi:hypothetical protein
MALRLGKSRGTIWTPPLLSDDEIMLEVAPLTPLLSEQIQNRFVSAQYAQTDDGKATITTTVKSAGMIREQAKAVTVGWKGIIGADDMGPLAGKDIPCSDKYKDLVFDEWDDTGNIAAHAVKYASKFAEEKDKQAKNSAPPSATP